MEDNPYDAELVQFELELAGFDFTAKVVLTEEDFIAGLEEFHPDLILSDYDLPKYNGALALAEAKRRQPDTPFILVTGAVSEDRAIEILTQGAKDYVLKNRLQQRLAPAVRRTIAEAEEHRARKQAEAKLREAYNTLEKKVEKRTAELEESRERLSLALTSCGMGAFEWDYVNKTGYFDDQVHHLLGLEGGTLGGRSEELVSIIHPDDLSSIKILFNKAVEQGGAYETECRVIWKNKSVHHIAVRGKMQNDTAGWPSRLLGVCWEITEKKKADEAIRKSEERFRKLVQNIPNVAVQGYGPDGTTQFWNKASEDIYGYSAQEAIGRNLLDLIIPPEMQDDVRTAIRLMAETGEPIPADELSLMRKGGSRAAVYSSHAIIKVPGREPELFCIDIDLAKRKKAEEELQKALHQFHILVSALRLSIVLVRDEKIELANQAFCGTLGLSKSPEELTGMSFYEFFDKFKHVYVHPDRELTRIKEIVTQGRHVTGEEIALANGRTVLCDFIPLDINGSPCRLWCYLDITEQKMMEKALRDSTG